MTGNGLFGKDEWRGGTGWDRRGKDPKHPAGQRPVASFLVCALVLYPFFLLQRASQTARSYIWGCQGNRNGLQQFPCCFTTGRMVTGFAWVILGLMSVDAYKDSRTCSFSSGDSLSSFIVILWIIDRNQGRTKVHYPQAYSHFVVL